MTKAAALELIKLTKETMKEQSRLNQEIMGLQKALEILLNNQKVMWEKLRKME